MHRKSIAILAACSLAAVFASPSALAHDCDTPAFKHRPAHSATSHAKPSKRVVKVSTKQAKPKARVAAKKSNLGLPRTQTYSVKHGCQPTYLGVVRECVCPGESQQVDTTVQHAGDWVRLQ